jgi:RNA polymerase-binding transcription factor DksA
LHRRGSGARLFAALAIHVQQQVDVSHAGTVARRGGGLLTLVKGPRAVCRTLPAMKPSQREQQRRALERRRAVLVDEISGGERGVPLDEAEAADEMRDHQELRDVDAALRRLAEGTYGICTDCGAEIGFERLHAEPEAARCVDCQRRHEKTYRRQNA